MSGDTWAESTAPADMGPAEYERRHARSAEAELARHQALLDWALSEIGLLRERVRTMESDPGSKDWLVSAMFGRCKEQLAVIRRLRGELDCAQDQIAHLHAAGLAAEGDLAYAEAMLEDSERDLAARRPVWVQRAAEAMDEADSLRVDLAHVEALREDAANERNVSDQHRRRAEVAEEGERMSREEIARLREALAQEAPKARAEFCQCGHGRHMHTRSTENQMSVCVCLAGNASGAWCQCRGFRPAEEVKP